MDSELVGHEDGGQPGGEPPCRVPICEREGAGLAGIDVESPDGPTNAGQRVSEDIVSM
jgi:hypothetical protein